MAETMPFPRPKLLATMYSFSSPPEMVQVPSNTLALERPLDETTLNIPMISAATDQGTATTIVGTTSTIATTTILQSMYIIIIIITQHPSSTPTIADIDADAAHNTILNPLATSGLVGRRILLFLSGFLLIGSLAYSIAWRIGGFLSPSGVFFVFFVLLFALGGASLFAYQPTIGLIITNTLVGAALGLWFVELGESTTPSSPAHLTALRGVSASIVGVAFGVVAFFLHRGVFAFLAALIGVFVTMLGIDCLANTGFTLAMQLLFEGQSRGFQMVQSGAYGILASWLIGAIMVTIFQLQWRNRKQSGTHSWRFRNCRRVNNEEAMARVIAQPMEKDGTADPGPRSPFPPRPASATWMKSQLQRMAPRSHQWSSTWLIPSIVRPSGGSCTSQDPRPALDSLFSSNPPSASRSALPVSTVRWCRDDSMPATKYQGTLDVIYSDSDSVKETKQSAVEVSPSSKLESSLSSRRSFSSQSSSNRIDDDSFNIDYGTVNLLTQTVDES
ncbi:hypothetical protein BDF22DRAFT_741904 [Syncephalis plumigaleata]|nr:hypothetical protein BDF22DRAFT_741904 [Syncephalis plumigaleata]